MKRFVIWSLTILLLILFLDKCTSMNVFSVFNRISYEELPNLKNGTHSKNYEIRRISEDEYKNIRYDPVGNYFLIEGHYDVKKIDAMGTEVFNLSKKEMYMPRFTSYVFDSTGVYDLSANKVEKQLFDNMINMKQELSEKAWQAQFDDFYRQADVVVYGYTDIYKNGDPIFMRVSGKWILLITTPHESRIREIEYVAGIRFEGYPARHNHLYLLKNASKKTYSDYEGTTDAYLKTYYEIALVEKSIAYPSERKVETLGYQKKSVYGEIAYTPIPVSWLCNTAQSIRLKEEEMVFKCVGIKEAGFSNYVDNRLNWFSVPQKYLSKTEVSFMIYAFPSNDEASENNGLYIVKKR